MARTARLDVSIWWNEATDHIHIAAAGQCISTVNCITGSKWCHPNLYWKLARALQACGMPHTPIAP